MELVDTVTDIPEFDAAWLDYCKYWNATAAEYVTSFSRTRRVTNVHYRQTARYGKSFKTTSFNQLYAKLQAYAGSSRAASVSSERGADENAQANG